MIPLHLIPNFICLFICITYLIVNYLTVLDVFIILFIFNV